MWCHVATFLNNDKEEDMMLIPRCFTFALMLAFWDLEVVTFHELISKPESFAPGITSTSAKFTDGLVVRVQTNDKKAVLFVAPRTWAFLPVVEDTFVVAIEVFLEDGPNSLPKLGDVVDVTGTVKRHRYVCRFLYVVAEDVNITGHMDFSPGWKDIPDRRRKCVASLENLGSMTFLGVVATGVLAIDATPTVP